jgi:ubiquinone/menaquinone biosynthesis C-methylase UbiE
MSYSRDRVTSFNAPGTVATESADWIISNMALHHVEDIPALVGELHRLLKPGGCVTIGELETEPGTFHAKALSPSPPRPPPATRVRRRHRFA